MQDQPTPIEILASIATFLRDTVIPEATAHTGFQARVAAKALDLVARQIGLAPVAEADEHTRLAELLGREGSLEELNRVLADGIATGTLDPSDLALRNHLLATTLSKLAIDQPDYSGYRAALAASQPEDA